MINKTEVKLPSAAQLVIYVCFQIESNIYLQFIYLNLQNNKNIYPMTISSN